MNSYSCQEAATIDVMTEACHDIKTGRGHVMCVDAGPRGRNPPAGVINAPSYILHVGGGESGVNHGQVMTPAV